MADAPSTSTADEQQALVQQLAYLIDEVEMLRVVIDRVPEAVLDAEPLDGTYSIKATYGLLATLDADVRRPRIERILANDEPELTPIDEADLVVATDWNARPIGDILDELLAARRRLVDYLRELPEEAWHETGRLDGEPVTVFGLLYDALQTDTAHQRTLGYRLHEANLTDRPQDLPK